MPVYNFRLFCAAVAACLLTAVTSVAAPDDTSLQGTAPTPQDYYLGIDDILDTVVFPLGRSSHKLARRQSPPFGTRVIFANSKATRLEGNRVLFQYISDDNRTYIRAIRHGLQASVASPDLAGFSTAEKIVFWLNLHNITVLEQLAERYPLTKVKTALYGRRGRPGILEEKLIQVGTAEFSLIDVQQMVIAMSNSPMVLYGFYLGSIGTPNIRRRAYRGETLWNALLDNGEEFVNSVRGTQVWGKRLKVSQHFKLGTKYFPDFEADLTAHLLSLINRPHIEEKMRATTKLSATISDWTLNSLNTSGVNFGAFTARSLAPLASAQVGSVDQRVTQFVTLENPRLKRLPPELREFARRLRNQTHARWGDGNVTIETIDRDKAKDSKENKN